MAKKKSLKERIDALVNALGAAKKPSSAQIRNELVALALDVEELEGGQALAEKDARISDLEAALEKSAVELRNIQVLLEQAGGELEAFRTEQKERQEKERDIDPVQLKVLASLGSQYSGRGLGMLEISRNAGIRMEEAEVYVTGLEKLGLAICQRHETEGVTWRRTAEGNRWVVAKRWAGEEEAQEAKPQAKHDELGVNETIALRMMAKKGDEGITALEIAERVRGGSTEMMFLYILVLLKQKNMVGDGYNEGHGPPHGTPRRWIILKAGVDYLAQRGLL